MSAPKWYKKLAVWQFITFILTPFAAGGEIAIITTGAHWGWHIGIGVITGFLGALKYFGKDDDGDGIVDILQKKKK